MISRKIVILDKDIIRDFTLLEATEALEEVLIETNIESLNIRTPQMSVNSLTASSIKQIPVVFGEADVIKAITLLPGVSSGGEGAAGFNVRGGAADQNLILLDEATSSLDTESEHLVQNAISILMKNRTTLVIAHRLSTIINSDQIIVLDSGNVAEVGTHEELLNKDGVYKKLYEREF